MHSGVTVEWAPVLVLVEQGTYTYGSLLPPRCGDGCALNHSCSCLTVTLLLARMKTCWHIMIAEAEILRPALPFRLSRERDGENLVREIWSITAR